MLRVYNKSMDLFQALILSVVEGVTEFLPISSTGHLILASRVLNIPQTEFVKSFEIYIQLGAILAVVVLYFQTLVSNIKLWKTLLVAFIPTALVGLMFYKMIKEVLLGNLAVTLLSLFIGGIVLIVFEKFVKEKEGIKSLAQINLRQAFLIGAAQAVSVIPGVSRSGASIVGGVLVGLNKQVAVEFSFLLAIPTMAAATGLDLLRSDFSFSSQEMIALLVGFTGSFITATLAIKLFLKYVQKNSFAWFGVYRIVLAITFWLFLNS